MDLHPITVHFTVALLFTALALELVGWLSGRDSFRHAGWWNLVAAAAAAIASVLSGRAAESGQPHLEEAHALVEAHELRGYVVLGALFFLLLLRAFVVKGPPLRAGGGRWRRAVYLLLFVAAAGVLFSGARLGGEMVYVHGVGVRPVQERIAAEPEHDHDHSH